MLDKEKPDLVSIVTPPDLHCPMSVAALNRGIHVLCEKPFAMNVEEAKQMNAAAENASNGIGGPTRPREAVRSAHSVRTPSTLFGFGWDRRAGFFAIL